MGGIGKGHLLRRIEKTVTELTGGGNKEIFIYMQIHMPGWVVNPLEK